MKKLNIGIMAHVDAGKTTVTEGFLFHSGVKNSMGNVDNGTTTTDSMELEKQRGMTIRSATVSFMIGETKINLIDTPGHMDFIAEVERALSVLDGVVLVISAKEGVQPQTRAIFHKIQQMKIPVIFFINKIDRLGVNTEEVYEQIKLQLTDNLLLMQRVSYEYDGTGQRFCLFKRSYKEPDFAEQVIVMSEKLLEKYMNNDRITEEDYENVIRSRIHYGKLYPVYHGTALKDVGIIELMEAVSKWFMPQDHKNRPLSAYIYKVIFDEHNHKLFYVRIFSGQLSIRMRTTIEKDNSEIIIRNLFGLENGRLIPVDKVDAGDVAVIMDAKELICGDWIGVKTKQHVFTQTEPLLKVGVRPVPPVNRRELLEALQILSMEDPYLDLNVDEETEEIQLRLFGNLQKEILQMLLKDRFHLDTEFDSVTTVKKDKPLDKITCIVPIFEQGNLLQAGVGLTLEPLEEGSGFQYETKVSFGDLTKSFQNGVREGVEKGIRRGLHGEVVDTKVTFMHSDYNSVTSTPADFRRLAEKVVYQALKEIGTKTMEPVMKYTLTAPQGYEKKVITELVRLNAVMEETEYTQSEMIIKGKVTLEACKDFATQLFTITEGRGIFETTFWQYRDVETDNRKVL
ncbi:elongation factor G [Anaerocolumna sp. MB42-C2]|uniref:elongation factor G n=1 Tax=Anaerocolumna sp. MB42-C2 TaxID=3070997 RepID=UPI0027DFEC7D|nr:TetM/TetW/TetO/TetS family tetracycline resistance ribosomal protection protein [Anaerocolumna sp. MB42-C2]WMJ86932.1 TetM/TetW/TetO/TetS family tetracycline resistance ribosomal protection protein [Anaerocolumna sp. MB42-C2]